MTEPNLAPIPTPRQPKRADSNAMPTGAGSLSTERRRGSQARGDYDTGVFSYGIIRRGERFGLRIVGSLKSQPALNVLAIYEK